MKFKTGRITNKLQSVSFNVKFLEKNPVMCRQYWGRKKELNKIVNVFPELRVLIGEKQHKTMLIF